MTLARITSTTALSALAAVSCGTNFSAIGPSPVVVAEGFTVAVIPDTQCYTSEGGGQQPGACGGPNERITNEIFLAQARYVDRAKAASRIRAVIGTGDIVNCGGNVTEWENARRGYDIIEAAGLPYAAAIGNHDYDQWCMGIATRSAANYNAFFGPARLIGRQWFGAHFPQGSNENHSIRFSADGREYVVITLEHRPRDVALSWATQIIASQGAAQVIIAMNEFLEPSGLRMSSAQAVWEQLVLPHENVMLVLDSHGRTAHRSDIGAAGYVVPQISQGYQFEELGGGGYMRLLNIRSGEGRIHVSTYSPYLGRWRADANNQYTVRYGRQRSLANSR